MPSEAAICARMVSGLGFATTGTGVGVTTGVAAGAGAGVGAGVGAL